MVELETWLARHWVIAAGFMAAALLAVAPVMQLPVLAFLIFLHSPAYMIHQVEEHSGDRFRRFANEHMFHGYEAMTVPAVLAINLPLVWGVNLLALYAAVAWGPAWGLAAPYFMLVNTLAHVAALARLRAYNPGLVTSLILFLPLSLASIWMIGLAGGVFPQVFGLVVGILLHLAIIVPPVTRYRSLTRAAGPAQRN